MFILSSGLESRFGSTYEDENLAIGSGGGAMLPLPSSSESEFEYSAVAVNGNGFGCSALRGMGRVEARAIGAPCSIDCGEVLRGVRLPFFD